MLQVRKMRFKVVDKFAKVTKSRELHLDLYDMFFSKNVSAFSTFIRNKFQNLRQFSLLTTGITSVK